MRALFIGIAAVALFSAAALAAVYVLTAGDPRPAAVAEAPAPVPEAPPAPVPLPIGGTSGPFYQPPPPGADLQPPPVPRYQPPKDSWEAVKPVARAGQLGPVGVDVGRDLIQLQDQLATCFSPEVASRHGRAAPTETLDPVRMQDLGDTILALQLETGSGSVRIVDAPIEEHGAADDMTISCAQQILRGRTIASATAKPGGRYRLLHQLHP